MAAPRESPVRLTMIAAILFVISLFLSAYSSRYPKLASLGSSALMELVRPAQVASTSTVGSVGSVWANYVWLVGVKSENSELKNRLQNLEARNIKLRGFEVENGELRNLLGMRQAGTLEGVVANVIGYDPTNWVQAITIDRGASDGIKRGQPVVDVAGVVGLVTSVGLSTSRVLLLTDTGSGVDALIETTQSRGVVVGSGRGRAVWKYVLGEAQVTRGDRVVTSGLDGIFPRGILIGTVIEIRNNLHDLFQDIELTPSVEFGHLSRVLVVARETTVDVARPKPSEEKTQPTKGSKK